MEGDFQAAVILICVIRELLEEDITRSLKSWYAEGLSSLFKKKKYCSSALPTLQEKCWSCAFLNAVWLFFLSSHLLGIAVPEIIRVKKKITDAHCTVLNVAIINDHYTQSNVCRLHVTVTLIYSLNIQLAIITDDNYTIIIIRSCATSFHNP